MEREKKLKKTKRRKTTLEAISVSHVSFIFVFRTRTEKRCMGKLFLCCHLAYFILRTLLNSLSSSFSYTLLFLDSFLYFLFSINRLLFLFYAFFAQLLPFPCFFYISFSFISSLSVRRHSSENAGCSFSMYEVFSITLKPVKSVSQMMLKLKKKQANPFLLQPSDFFRHDIIS